MAGVIKDNHENTSGSVGNVGPSADSATPAINDDNDGAIDEFKGNEAYINKLADGDLKQYLQNHLDDQKLIHILNTGNFKTLDAIYSILKTSKEMVNEARNSGIKVTFSDFGAIGSFWDFLEKRRSSGM